MPKGNPAGYNRMGKALKIKNLSLGSVREGSTGGSKGELLLGALLIAGMSKGKSHNSKKY